MLLGGSDLIGRGRGPQVDSVSLTRQGLVARRDGALVADPRCGVGSITKPAVGDTLAALTSRPCGASCHGLRRLMFWDTGPHAKQLGSLARKGPRVAGRGE